MVFDGGRAAKRDGESEFLREVGAMGHIKWGLVQTSLIGPQWAFFSVLEGVSAPNLIHVGSPLQLRGRVI